MMLKRGLFVCISVLFSLTVQANTESSIAWLPISVDSQDKEALQRGAKVFMNYCSGCHSLRYMRYNRMAVDLGLVTFDGQLNKDLLVNNLIFTRAKVQDPIEISMPEEDARKWFGTVPPDLSLVARKRGIPWVYNFLKGFYEDKSRPFGANNLLIPATAMPNILAPLAGVRVAIHDNAAVNAPISHLIVVKNGQMTEQQFDATLRDLLSFLAYVGEPMKQERMRIGYFIIPFLGLFLWVLFLLKNLYWKKLKQK